jgi:subtilisin family serine protease
MSTAWLALVILQAHPARIAVAFDVADLHHKTAAPLIRDVVNTLGGIEVMRLPFATIIDVPDESQLPEQFALLKAVYPHLRWVERDIIIQVQLRQVPTDPLYNRQWYLHQTAFSVPDATIDVEGAWEKTLGDNVKVAIIDDGFDLTHPDLVDRYSTDRLDISQDPADNDPSGSGSDYHGTATAGVVAASWNGIDTAGICPHCTLLPVRLFSEKANGNLQTTSTAAATAFTWSVDHGASVVNNSWGPPDGSTLNPNAPVTLWEQPQILADAIKYAVTHGRNNLGTVISWAAGNGNELATYDRFASDPRVIAVGAISSDGQHAYYSDFGPTVAIVTPSSGDGGQPGIYTSDPVGNLGSSNADYTPAFGGTSAAAAVFSGVAALVIAQYPNLTAAQIREAILLSAAQIDPVWGRYIEGRSYHYGYGRIDAANALAFAATYTNSCTLHLELCGNAIDDNCDAIADVDDPSCTVCLPDSSFELCDNKDNNCDGRIDEGFVCTSNERPTCAPCSISSECASDHCISGSPDFLGKWCFPGCTQDSDCADDFYCRNGTYCVPITDATIRSCDDLYDTTERCDRLDNDKNDLIDDTNAEAAPTDLCAAKSCGKPKCTNGHWTCDTSSCKKKSGGCAATPTSILSVFALLFCCWRFRSPNL